MDTLALLGTLLGLGFTSGINLYATVFATGLALRMGWLTLPPWLGSLQVLGEEWIVIVAGALYAVEFLADKVPAVDHAWDAVHSFIRPVGAGLLAWTAVRGAGLDPVVEIPLILAVGGVALSSHAVKAGTRVVAASAGGHFLGVGVGLSLLEDLVALAVAFLSFLAPVLVLGGLVVFGVLLWWLAPRLLRAAGGALGRVRGLLGPRPGAPPASPGGGAG
ncbi:DUF4126 domain-containing protein [Myxococcota bacterium]|nr:DUF4126 domain-containing protein [Myxococcota bacterium]